MLAHTPITEAIGLMKMHGISQLPVIDEGELKGVLHEKLVLEAALKSGNITAKAGDLADNNYCTIDRHTRIKVATDLLRKTRIALVYDKQDLVRVLTRIDIIAHVARQTAATNS